MWDVARVSHLGTWVWGDAYVYHWASMCEDSCFCNWVHYSETRIIYELALFSAQWLGPFCSILCPHSAQHLGSGLLCFSTVVSYHIVVCVLPSFTCNPSLSPTTARVLCTALVYLFVFLHVTSTSYVLSIMKSLCVNAWMKSRLSINQPVRYKWRWVCRHCHLWILHENGNVCDAIDAMKSRCYTIHGYVGRYKDVCMMHRPLTCCRF